MKNFNNKKAKKPAKKFDKIGGVFFYIFFSVVFMGWGLPCQPCLDQFQEQRGQEGGIFFKCIKHKMILFIQFFI